MGEITNPPAGISQTQAEAKNPAWGQSPPPLIDPEPLNLIEVAENGDLEPSLPMF